MQRVQHDERAVARSRASRSATPSKRQPRRARDREHERDQHEQRLLPRRDDVERGAAHAGLPQLGHHEVVQREADDEARAGPDRAVPCRHSDSPSRGPAATSVIPRLTIRTGYGKSAASSRGPSGSSTSSKPRARKSRSRRGPGGSQCANGSSVCGSSGNQPVRRRHEHAPRDPAQLGDELPLALLGRPRRARRPRSRSRGRTRRRRRAGSRPSARTAVTRGNAAAKRSSSVWPTAVIRSGQG